MKKAMERAASLVAALVFAGTAHADIVVSTSNNPQIEISDQAPRLRAPAKASKAAEKMRRKDNMQAIFDMMTERDADREGAEATLPATAAKLLPQYTNAWLDNLPTADGGAEWACLTEALYFEARGESVQGQFAVAEVILNRVDSKRFPDTVCGVVNQGTGEKWRCQFTYTCDGLAEVINEPAAYGRVGKVAKVMLDGAERVLTGGATHYHTTAVSPRWARVFPRTTQIGVHRFYRDPGAV